MTRFVIFFKKASIKLRVSPDLAIIAQRKKYAAEGTSRNTIIFKFDNNARKYLYFLLTLPRKNDQPAFTVQEAQNRRLKGKKQKLKIQRSGNNLGFTSRGIEKAPSVQGMLQHCFCKCFIHRSFSYGITTAPDKWGLLQ
jgi:hypothetical protein